MIGADGSDATRLFHTECCPGDGWGPVWSPDGSRIAFWIYVDVPFNSQLVVNADGTGSPERRRRRGRRMDPRMSVVQAFATPTDVRKEAWRR